MKVHLENPRAERAEAELQALRAGIAAQKARDAVGSPFVPRSELEQLYRERAQLEAINRSLMERLQSAQAACAEMRAELENLKNWGTALPHARAKGWVQ